MTTDSEETHWARLEKLDYKSSGPRPLLFHNAFVQSEDLWTSAANQTHGTPTSSIVCCRTNRFRGCRLADRCQTLGGDYLCKSVSRNSATIANTTNPKNREKESANPHE